ncbi:Hint domain-containing protein [Phaeovulum sp. W22_SRMD_FR3]|uniref:Hint domain-containing protein n=1 Tax=Phaeovulum sp. W22_SRMD_FR3 TaxID=3240274 RepID=UPI003F9BD16D
MTAAAPHAQHQMRPPCPNGWQGARLPEGGPYLLSTQPLPALLSTGSLMLEFTRERGALGTQPLLHHAHHSGWSRQLSLVLDHRGQLCAYHRQGVAQERLILPPGPEMAEGGTMRLSWRWDGPARHSSLTLEAPDHGVLRQHQGSAPIPLPAADARAVLGHAGDGSAGADTSTRTAPPGDRSAGLARLGPGVTWLALSDQAQPLGPGACFAPATRLNTPQGPRPAGNIRRGDWVETVDAGPQQVLWSGRMSLPALGGLAPIRLLAGHFGQAHDLWLHPQHRVAVSGAAVEYLFGQDAVLIEARHLVDGRSALRCESPRALVWQGVLLRDHHLLIADGCHVESLYLGNLATAAPLLAQGPMAGLADPPRHRRPVRPTLRDYEAQTLLAARAQSRAPYAA